MQGGRSVVGADGCPPHGRVRVSSGVFVLIALDVELANLRVFKPSHPTVTVSTRSASVFIFTGGVDLSDSALDGILALQMYSERQC